MAETQEEAGSGVTGGGASRSDSVSSPVIRTPAAVSEPHGDQAERECHF